MKIPSQHYYTLPANRGIVLQQGAGTSLVLVALRFPKRFTCRTVVAIDKFHRRTCEKIQHSICIISALYVTTTPTPTHSPSHINFEQVYEAKNIEKTLKIRHAD